jgi:hypothetical protein
MAELDLADYEELLEGILRDRVGVDPQSLRLILRLTAIGLVNSAWRNTCVEGWHAEGRLSDGDMLRISSQMTWRMDQMLWRWRAEMGIAPDALACSLDEIGFDDLLLLGGRICQWIVSPRRRLATGVALGEVAQDGLHRLEEDSDELLTDFVYQAEGRVAGFAFRRAAAHGGLACRHWWGHPAWPDLVDIFVRILDDHEDPHWGDGGEFRAGLLAEPVAVRDRAGLRQALLRRPWDLDPGSAQWIVAAGISNLRHRVVGPVGHVAEQRSDLPTHHVRVVRRRAADGPATGSS